MSVMVGDKPRPGARCESDPGWSCSGLKALLADGMDDVLSGMRGGGAGSGGVSMGETESSSSRDGGVGALGCVAFGFAGLCGRMSCGNLPWTLSTTLFFFVFATLFAVPFCGGTMASGVVRFDDSPDAFFGEFPNAR